MKQQGYNPRSQRLSAAYFLAVFIVAGMIWFVSGGRKTQNRVQTTPVEQTQESLTETE